MFSTGFDPAQSPGARRMLGRYRHPPEQSTGTLVAVAGSVTTTIVRVAVGEALGVRVAVAVAVAVGVAESVPVGVAVHGGLSADGVQLRVGVALGVRVAVAVREAVAVADGVRVTAGGLVAVRVAVGGRGVCVRVAVGGTAVLVRVAVGGTIVAVTVAVVVAVRLGVGVAVGGMKPGEASKAPISHTWLPLPSPSTGRGKPRWSEESVKPFCSLQPAGLPASMAGLPASSACVNVSPPLP